jgi:hypothetical protein
MQEPIEHNKQMAFGGLQRFGQQMIHQASIAVDCMFEPFSGEDSQKAGLLNGIENIPTGGILFSKVKRTAAAVQALKKRRLMNHTRTLTAATRRQPTVFCNVKFVNSYNEIVFAGVSDTEITINNDDWRYRAGRSVIPVISGTRTVMNTGPDDIWEGEWVYYETPKLSKDAATGKSPHPEFTNEGTYNCHRAVLRPVTLANYKADPDCIYRTVGKCVAFSRSGQMLDLSISSAVAPIPFGAKPAAAAYAAAAGPLPSASGVAVAASAAPVSTSTAPSAPPVPVLTYKGDITVDGNTYEYSIVVDEKGKTIDSPSTIGGQPLPTVPTGDIVLDGKSYPYKVELNSTLQPVIIVNNGPSVTAKNGDPTAGRGDGWFARRRVGPTLQLHPSLRPPMTHHNSEQKYSHQQQQRARRTHSGLDAPPAALAAAAAARAKDLPDEEDEEEEEEDMEDDDAQSDITTTTTTLSSSGSKN